MKGTSSKGYYVTLESNFALSDIMEHDSKKGWNSRFLWKLTQTGDIM